MGTVRVVFDCMVFLQAAARQSGPAGACLEVARARHVQLFVSQDVLEEVSDVLNRPTVRARFPRLTASAVESFIDEVRKPATVQTGVPDVWHLDRDPKDSPYINLAHAVRADYLVSRDKDLLDLMTAQNAGAHDFRTRFATLKIVTPIAFLRSVATTIE